MKHENIADKARVWTVTRGPDDTLIGQVDPALVNALLPGLTSEQIADLLVAAAGAAYIANTRAW